MTEENHEWIRDYLDGCISEADLESLNLLLESDSEARARFRSFAVLDEGLRDLAALPAMDSPDETTSTTQPSLVSDPTLLDRKGKVLSGFFSRPLLSAVAGLVIGVFCTSVMWAASESGRRKILSLLHESFESGAAPQVTGIPTQPETWTGDFTEVVSEKDGVLPVHGRRMLQFLRADHEGKASKVGYIGDLYRVVDLRSYESDLAHDDAVVSVEAGFRSVPFEDPERFQCGISIYAVSAMPSGTEEWKALFETHGKLMEDSLATAQRWIFLDPMVSDWQRARTELRVPMEARYLVIGIRISDRDAIRADGEEPPAVAFSGQFVDDVRVVLSRVPSLD